MPGRLNLGTYMLSRGKVAPGEWALHPQTVQEIWLVFGRAEVDLFASEDNSHCPTYFDTARCSGPRLAQCSPIRISPDRPDSSGRQVGQGDQVLSHPSGPALEELGLVPRASADLSSSPMAHSAEEEPSLTGERHDLASLDRAVEPPPFRAQVISLLVHPIADGEQGPNTLCSVRALRVYLERSSLFRQSKQLFVCFGGCQKGLPATKQRLSRWIVDAIALAYASVGLQWPIGVSCFTGASSVSLMFYSSPLGEDG